MAEKGAAEGMGPTIAPPASALQITSRAASAGRVRSGRELRQQRELLGTRQTRCAWAVEARDSQLRVELDYAVRASGEVVSEVVEVEPS